MTDVIVRPAAAAIELVDITKRFGTAVALDRATLAVRYGTVHALLGENGAGKTTLMRVAFGMVHPDAGRLEVHGRSVSWGSPADAMVAGIGMVHQHFTLVPAMTVAENVELGTHTGGRIGRWHFDRQMVEERVRVLGRASGLIVEPGTVAAELSIAAQQRVEILKALGHDARILILDEPTAVLAPREIDELLRWLRSYVDNGGTAVLITHKLREALAVADDLTVLRRGRTVLTSRTPAVDERSLTRAMIGDELTPARSRARAASAAIAAPAVSQPRGEPIVVLEDVIAVDSERRERIHATLTVQPGEIVAVAGIEGAGQHALLRVIAGRIPAIAGQLKLPTEIGFIPEDRHRDGLILDFSLAENVALRGAGQRHGRMSWTGIREQTTALMRAFDIRASNPTTTTSTLSGGNQQRLILARELDGQPPLIVAENPTHGLDVRAAADMLDRLQTAREAGTAIVLYSSDLDEVLALASRVLAVYAGSVREVAPEKDVVGRAIIGPP